MNYSKAIVTIAIGEQYIFNWKKYCLPSWRRYCDRHGFDLVAIEEPLDSSERGGSRSVAWQKCLILGQEFANSYERIVWVDSDILFNNCAPDVTAGVPVDKVGVVEDLQFSYPNFIRRALRLWGEGEAVINYTAEEYYKQYGLPDDVDRVFNTGVLVLSPKYHRSILEHVYYAYEEKEGGRKWHMEQRPLAYEIIKSGMAHWIDPRFNVNLWFEEYAHYPFLQRPPSPRGPRPTEIGKRIRQKFKTAESRARYELQRKLRTEMVNTVFQASYFLHFASRIEEMPLVREHPESWWDVLE
jgi:hypothetical protein